MNTRRLVRLARLEGRAAARLRAATAAPRAVFYPRLHRLENITRARYKEQREVERRG